MKPAEQDAPAAQDVPPVGSTISSLTDTVGKWFDLALGDQVDAALALVGGDLDVAAQMLSRARRKLELAQVALNDARALKRKAAKSARAKETKGSDLLAYLDSIFEKETR